MISVILDEEIVEKFGCKSFLYWFTAGNRVTCLNGEWIYEERENWVFYNFQYDEEFTEWLKENRPEVFL